VILEIRRYQTHPGKRDEWVTYMEETIIPFQSSKGMVIPGSFIDEEDENGYIWLRTFKDEDERKALYAAVYEDPEWVNDIGPKIPAMMIREKISVTRAIPTPASGMQ
jgi:hypothetical protein